MAANDSVASLVAGVERESKKNKASADLSRFIRITLAGATSDDLEAYDARELAGLLADSFAFLARRQPGRPKIRASNPAGALAHISVIDIINDDMPFLVDSTLGLLNERGLDIRLMLHPVLNVAARPLQGALTEHRGQAVSRARDDARELDPRPSVARLPDAELGSSRPSSAAYLRRRARRRPRLAHHAAAAQAGDRRLPVRPAAYSRRRTHRSDRLPDVACRQPLHLSRHARIHVRGRRGEAASWYRSNIRVWAFLRKPRNPRAEARRKAGRHDAGNPPVSSCSPPPLIITKADVRATVHRRAAMDYVGVKLFDAQGELTGELSIVGLFTSSAYTQNPSRHPPAPAQAAGGGRGFGFESRRPFRKGAHQRS